MTQEEIDKVTELTKKLNDIKEIRENLDGVVSLEIHKRTSGCWPVSKETWRIISSSSYHSTTYLGEMLEKHLIEIKKEIEEDISQIEKELTQL